MRSLLPALLALACPVGMCLVPMLLARRKGQQARSAMSPADDSLSEGERRELHRLRTEVDALRDERPETEGADLTDSSS